MFDVAKETDRVINFVRNYYQEKNLSGAILGVSGGKDSAVAAALMVKAIGSENVIGVTMPCHSINEDKNDAQLLSDYYGFKLINFDLTNVFDVFQEEAKKLIDFDINLANNSNINLKPRIRMATLYYLAALYTQITGKTYLVVGTSNKCELYVGYFTKGGDSVHDIALLEDFNVEQVIKIGEYLNVPEKILYKIPNDGLSGMSDEEKLGIKYEDIAKYIDNPNSIPKEVAQKIEKLHNSSVHKFNIPTYKREEE